MHRIFNATSTWPTFESSLERFKIQLENNHYPPVFYEPIILETLEKIIRNGETQTVARPDRGDKRSTRPLLLLQYRGKISDQLSKRVRKCSGINVVFTTTKLRTCFPSLKSPVSKELSSRVVYQIECLNCQARFVGQTARHFKRRLSELLMPSAPVARHLHDCCGMQADETSILDRSCDIVKLETLEAVYIEKLKPSLNTKEE